VAGCEWEYVYANIGVGTCSSSTFPGLKLCNLGSVGGSVFAIVTPTILFKRMLVSWTMSWNDGSLTTLQPCIFSTFASNPFGYVNYLGQTVPVGPSPNYMSATLGPYDVTKFLTPNTSYQFALNCNDDGFGYILNVLIQLELVEAVTE